MVYNEERESRLQASQRDTPFETRNINYLISDGSDMISGSPSVMEGIIKHTSEDLEPAFERDTDPASIDLKASIEGNEQLTNKIENLRPSDQIHILCFKSQIPKKKLEKIAALSIHENNLGYNDSPKLIELLSLLENEDKPIVALYNMIRWTNSPKDVIKSLKMLKYSDVTIGMRYLDVSFYSGNKTKNLSKYMTLFEVNVSSLNKSITLKCPGDDIEDVIKENVSSNTIHKAELYRVDSSCKTRKLPKGYLKLYQARNKLQEKNQNEEAKHSRQISGKKKEQKSTVKKIDSEIKMEKVSVISMALNGNSEDWPMMVVKKASSTAVPPLTRPPLFSICESKRLMREDVGLQFTNTEVALPFLTMVLKEVLPKELHFHKKTVPDRIHLPDGCQFEHLSLFKHFGMSPLVFYLFLQEVDSMMENNFNRLASFKDWPLSAPVSALRLVDSGFYYDVQRRGVACSACKLLIEIGDLSSELRNDTVLNMHLRLSENCPHALQQKREKEQSGGFLFPFLRPKSEMNSTLLNTASAIQKDYIQNPLPEINRLEINEKNISNSSFNFNSQNEMPNQTAKKNFSIFSNVADSKTGDSGFGSQSNFGNSVGSIAKASGFPIQTETPDSLSYMPILSESSLQPSSLFGDPISSSISKEEEISPNQAITANETSEKQVSPIVSTTLPEEDQSYSIRHHEYKTVEARLRTYSNWPLNDKQSKEDLVLCGFFYTGQQDIVRCFSCDIGLAEWDETDNPWSEHARHSPHCKYLKKMKGQDFINHVQQEWRKIYNPKTPHMQELSKRFETFTNWPTTNTQTPKQVAEAGFYFTGEEDAVRCHYCDGGLREWEPGDDPWTEHARWFPFCKFVMKIKGIQFIEEIQQRYIYETGAGNLDSPPASGYNVSGKAKPSEEDNNPLNSPAAQSVLGMGYSKVKVQHVIDKFVAEKGHNKFDAGELLVILLDMEDNGETFPPETSAQTSTSKQTSKLPDIYKADSESDSDVDPEVIEEENQMLKKQLLCIKCEQAERVIVFTPCGHRLVCKACADPMKRCIKCRKKIQKKVKTFLC